MNLTKMTWELGREKYKMTNKEIRANWGNLYREVYDNTMRAAQDGIDAIFQELENTISSHTKTSQTEEAEQTSLDNIKKVVQAGINTLGTVEAFNRLADLYDNGTGEWIQRITAAIYDRELAEWSSGVPAYMSRLQSEVADAFQVSAKDLDLNTDFIDLAEDGADITPGATDYSNISLDDLYKMAGIEK